jgi:predicted chitinase
MQESTEEAGVSLIMPTETVIAIIDSPNLDLPWTTIHTVRRKAAKRSEKWYQKKAAPLPTQSRKKRRLEEPLLPLRRNPRRLITTSSTGASVPPPNATDVASTRRQSACQTKAQLSPIETSEAQLDGDDDADADDANVEVGDLSGSINARRLSELAEYRRLHGHCNVPNRYSENTKMAHWVVTQRKQYKVYQEGKKSSLTLSRIQELENMGFEWDVLGVTWQSRLSELADYRKLYGHCNVPQRYSENIQLGTWVSTQRKNYMFHRQGKTSPITPFRIQELESLGFEWNILGATWADRLSELGDFREIHGHCNVPHHYTENTKLGYWVGMQKKQYKLYLKGKKSPMTPLRFQALKTLCLLQPTC